MSCICIAIVIVYLLFLPLLPVDPMTAGEDTVEYDYYVDDQTPTIELPGKQCPFPSPTYRLPFRIILALGIAATAITLIPILMHNLFSSPLIVVPYLPMLLRIITHQLALCPCPYAMLNYRVAVTLGSERGNFTLLQLHRNARQGKKSGDPTVPAIGIVTGRRGRHLPVCGGPGLCLLSVIYPLNHESRATPRLLAK